MYKVAITENHHQQLFAHLMRRDKQEDLCFGLYLPAKDSTTETAIIKEIIFPESGDRIVHGNVSFTSQYFDRVTKIALAHQCGICFMHSHHANGWQDMSDDDVATEEGMAPRVKAITGLPLVGLTLGKDHFWSARFWRKTAPKEYVRCDCTDIRVVGKAFRTSPYPDKNSAIVFDEAFERTISAWGEQKQSLIANLKIGIVGLGSVGAMVAEAMIKTGVRHLVLIDFDIVKRKNLDRLNGIGPEYIGQLKVEAVKKYLLSVAADPAEISIETVPYSIAEKEGGDAALGCDIIMSCVDRPWPRMILNSLAYANYLPVIDGGIDCSRNKKGDNLGQARWKAHTVGPGRRCLCCLGQYRPEDAALEQSGALDDQHYIKDLPAGHFVNRGENVFVFSMSLAGMLMQQFLSLILQPNGQYIGPKEYNFNSGVIDSDFSFDCEPKCFFSSQYLGQGQNINKHLFPGHRIAIQSRALAIPSKRAPIPWWRRLFNNLSFIFKSNTKIIKA